MAYAARRQVEDRNLFECAVHSLDMQKPIYYRQCPRDSMNMEALYYSLSGKTKTTGPATVVSSVATVPFELTTA